MSDFTHVTVTKKANIYFGGNVTSRSLHFADGSHKTLGIMLPGEYEFNTDAPERMEILSGDLEVRLPGKEGWLTVRAGEDFHVPGKARFQLKVRTVTDYCCSFLRG